MELDAACAILGVGPPEDTEAYRATLREALKSALAKTHPDRPDGDTQAFVSAKHAYEALLEASEPEPEEPPAAAIIGELDALKVLVVALANHMAVANRNIATANRNAIGAEQRIAALEAKVASISERMASQQVARRIESAVRAKAAEVRRAPLSWDPDEDEGTFGALARRR